MKTIKRSIGILLCVVMVCSMSFAAFAAPPEEIAPMNVNLREGNSWLTQANGRQLRIEGYTKAYAPSGKVKVTLSLLRDDGISHQVESFTNTTYNSSSATINALYTVNSSGWYRILGSHYVIDGGITESFASNTNWMWVP